MKTFKASVLSGIITGLSLIANSQSFVNLNFEAASTQASSLGYPFLEWSTAAPGWGHSSGSDTSYVYYQQSHVGFTQFYLLMNATSPVWAPGTQLAGNYSLMLKSGRQSLADINSPWVNAYISQTATIPAGSLSLRMLATGPFDVRVGGVGITMYSLGGNSYGGDISAFAGSLAELRILNTAGPSGGPMTVVDNISFSPVAIPEPSTLAFAGLGALSLMLVRRKPAGQLN